MKRLRSARRHICLPRIEIAAFEWVYWLLVFGCVALITQGWLERSAFFLGSGVVGFFLLVYAGWIEPRRLTVASFQLALVEQPKTTLRIVFLSDFHAGAYKGKRFYERVTRCVQHVRPDLVILGGDLVEEYAESVRDLSSLAHVKARYGRFFLLGNHDFSDHPDRVASRMQRWGYENLTNRLIHIEADGRSCELIGLDETWHGSPKIELLRTPHTKPRIVIVHEPDGLLDVHPGDADVVVMGHTHGGQVRLPFFGIVHPMPQRISKSFDRGLKEWRGIPVIISQGLGEATTRLRFGCPPQIVVMEIGI